MDKIISCKHFRERIDSLGMGVGIQYSGLRKAVELLEDEPEASLLDALPCKIGDIMWGIKSTRNGYCAQSGIVSEMFFTKEMKLMIVIKYVSRGHFGESIFKTQSECEVAIQEKLNKEREPWTV